MLAGQELTEAEIGKGYEFSKDEIIPITDLDLAEMPLPTVKAIGTAAFVPWDGIGLRHIGESAYLISADGPAESRGQEERTCEDGSVAQEDGSEEGDLRRRKSA